MGANFVVTEFLYGVAAGESTCDTLVALCAPPHGFNSDTACVCTGLIRVSDRKGGLASLGWTILGAPLQARRLAGPVRSSRVETRRTPLRARRATSRARRRICG